VEDLVRHVLLALTMLALGHAALRAASTVAPAGLERLLVTVVLAVAAAVLQALALGVVDLGASAAALCGATAVLWAAATIALPAPAVRPLAELAVWWRGAGGAARAAVAVGGGAAGGWVVWQLANPAIGFDGSAYHYAEVAGWIANGTPGSILTLSYDLVYGNYPLTDEVALTWMAAIARSWVPLSLWNVGMLGVLVAGAAVTLRNLEVPRLPAALAVVALAGSPVVLRQLNEPQTDLPTVAWLACTAALATGARRRPALLAPALVAAGLTLGTKTTAVGVLAAALAVGVVLARGRIRPLAGWLALGAAAAFAVGGVWYVRNLVQHGSPLWPFAPGPWGDPRPPYYDLIDASLADHPRATLSGRLDDYSARLGGIVLLLAGAVVALVAGATDRAGSLRRPLVAAGAVAVLATVLFTLAPGTGHQADLDELLGSGWPVATVRYVLPAAFAAAVAAALVSRVAGRLGTAGTALLAVAAAWSLVATARTGSPWVPPLAPLAAGAAGGALALFAVTLLGRRLPWRAATLSPRAAGAAAAVGAVALGAALTPAGDGYVSRHATVDDSTALGRSVVGWFAARPDFRDGESDVAFISRSVLAPLAGDHFEHRLRLVPAAAPCSEVRRVARSAPVVLTDPDFLRNFLGTSDFDSGRCLADRRADFRDPAYRVYAP
jgi:hypothetical protein